MEYRSLNKLKFVISQSAPTQVTPSPSPSGPIGLPGYKPVFTGVNLCGSPDANKESCSACDKIAIMPSRIGSIRNVAVEAKLTRARNALAALCAIIGGCSTSQAGNIAPYQDGTACVCDAFMKLTQSFDNTLGDILDKASRGIKISVSQLQKDLVEQETTAKKAIIRCFDAHRVSDNTTAEQKILGIINTYAG
jgi:hypothetical protein